MRPCNSRFNLWIDSRPLKGKLTRQLAELQRI